MYILILYLQHNEAEMICLGNWKLGGYLHRRKLDNYAHDLFVLRWLR